MNKVFIVSTWTDLDGYYSKTVLNGVCSTRLKALKLKDKLDMTDHEDHTSIKEIKLNEVLEN